MIFGLGTDIIEVKRIAKSVQKKSFRERVFTKNEIGYCDSFKNKDQNYAARFSAKEAFLKATGFGLRNGFTFLDIDIQKDENEKPFIVCSGKIKEFLEKNNINNIYLTMSHIKDFATATVILEK